jgi:hypothetical protein
MFGKYSYLSKGSFPSSGDFLDVLSLHGVSCLMPGIEELTKI